MQNSVYNKEINSLYHDLNSFNMGRYEETLKSLKQKWNFKCPNDKITSKSLFLRHDIDYSLDNTLVMARIEDSLGIHAHYYFLTESTSYNINSKKFRDSIDELLAYNVCVGLHFDWVNRNLPAIYDFETQIKALQLKTKSEVIHFSPHNPGSLDMADSYDFPKKYLNAYSFLKKHKMGYLSDSNGSWNKQFLDEFIQNIDVKPYQILIHPEWWSYNSSDPITKIIQSYTNEYLENLKTYYKLHEKSEKFEVSKLEKLTEQISAISKAIMKIIG
jgi:hypothetical protein